MRRKGGRFITMQDVPVILDLGHYALKGIVGDDAGLRADMLHGLQEMDRDEWQSVVAAGNQSHPDYIRVGTKYFEVGETALRHSLVPQAEGTARYRRNYYGVLMCAMITRLLDPGDIRGAVVFASYPPGDRRHKDELETALLGNWECEHMGRTFRFLVKRVVTYAEPMGGFWNYIIQSDENGQYDNPEYEPEYNTLVIDFGGGTMSMLPIGRNQQPDYRRAYSFPIGFNIVAEWFVRELRANHRDMFRGSRALDASLVHTALQTGLWHGGGHIRGLDVSREVNTALTDLIMQFRAGFSHLGGDQDFGQILFTGGGSIVLGERIKSLVGHPRMFYAHDVLSELAYANVLGGLKAYREIMGDVMS